MSRRFPNYQPSTALRQAIEALRRAQANRQAVGLGRSAAQATDRAAAVTQPDPPGGPGASVITPGRESTGIGEGSGEADTDALTSGRHINDED